MALSDDVQAGVIEPGEPVDQQALDWYVRAREGLDARERAALERWLEPPAHRQAYRRWATEWQALDTLPGAAVAALRQGCEPAAAPPAWGRRRFLAGAAACAGVAGVGVGLVVHRQWSASASVREYLSAVGGQDHAILPDGSRIDLDSATGIEVAYQEDRRELTLLRGQVLLEVLPDAARPFVVRAGDVRIRVTGTRFAVRHTPGQAGFDGVRVAVAAGSVRVAPGGLGAARPAWLGGQAPVDLAAGQQLQAGASWRVAPVAVADVAAWQQNRLVVDDMTLEQVLGEFARYGHEMPRLGDARVAGMRLGGAFHLRQPSAFYRVLPQILPVTVEEAGGQRVIRAVG